QRNASVAGEASKTASELEREAENLMSTIAESDDDQTVGPAEQAACNDPAQAVAPSGEFAALTAA
ncbi:MAG: hypothetical protein AAF698_02360, partial [Pseudomonadota bacterium]